MAEAENQKPRGKLPKADGALNHCRIMQADILSQTNGRQETPLHCILHLYPDIELTDIMPLLQRSSPQLNKTNCDGNSPLHVALINPNVKLEVVTEFIRRGASATMLNNGWNTPLHLAIHYKQSMDVIRTILQHMDRRFVDRPNKRDFTPLGIAVKQCYYDAVKELIRYGADINKRNTVGESLLHAVNVPDDPKIVKLMLKLGAVVEAVDRAGNTPLIIAAREAHIHSMKLLLENGASVNARNNEGRTPLHFMSWRRENSAVVNLLVQSGADCCARDRMQRKPMYYAAKAVNGYDGTMGGMKTLIVRTLFKSSDEDSDIKENKRTIKSSRLQGRLSRHRKACLRELETMKSVVLHKGISLYDVISRKLEIHEVVPDEDVHRVARIILRELCSDRYPKYHYIMLEDIQKEWLVTLAMDLKVYTVVRKYEAGRKRFKASLNRDVIEMISTHFTNRDALYFIKAFSTPC